MAKKQKTGNVADWMRGYKENIQAFGEALGVESGQPTGPEAPAQRKPQGQRQLWSTPEWWEGLQPRELATALSTRTGVPSAQVLALLNAGMYPADVVNRIQAMMIPRRPTVGGPALMAPGTR